MENEDLTDESVWPTWYTVQVWNEPGDLFVHSSYANREVAVQVARNLKKYYDGRMHEVTLRRWSYEPNPWEVSGGEVEPSAIISR